MRNWQSAELVLNLTDHSKLTDQAKLWGHQHNYRSTDRMHMKVHLKILVDPRILQWYLSFESNSVTNKLIPPGCVIPPPRNKGSLKICLKLKLHNDTVWKIQLQ